LTEHRSPSPQTNEVQKLDFTLCHSGTDNSVVGAFVHNMSEKTRGIGFDKAVSPTLKTDNSSAVILRRRRQDG